MRDRHEIISIMYQNRHFIPSWSRDDKTQRELRFKLARARNLFSEWLLHQTQSLVLHNILQILRFPFVVDRVVHNVWQDCSAPDIGRSLLSRLARYARGKAPAVMLYDDSNRSRRELDDKLSFQSLLRHVRCHSEARRVAPSFGPC